MAAFGDGTGPAVVAGAGFLPNTRASTPGFLFESDGMIGADGAVLGVVMVVLTGELLISGSKTRGF